MTIREPAYDHYPRSDVLTRRPRALVHAYQRPTNALDRLDLDAGRLTQPD